MHLSVLLLNSRLVQLKGVITDFNSVKENGSDYQTTLDMKRLVTEKQRENIFKEGGMALANSELKMY